MLGGSRMCMGWWDSLVLSHLLDAEDWPYADKLEHDPRDTIPQPMSTTSHHLRQLAAAIDARPDWWRFPQESVVQGFMGEGPLFLVGDQPSTSSWSYHNPGRRALYDALAQLGLGGAHLTDLYKRRGPASQLAKGLPDDFDEHLNFFAAELEALAPIRVVAMSQLAYDLLRTHVSTVIPMLDRVWHFAYAVRAQRVDEYEDHLRSVLVLGSAQRTASPAPPPEPVPSALAAAGSAFAVRVERAPDGVHTRTWVLRRDNHAHHHGVVHLSGSPLYLNLSWREDRNSPAHHVGLFRLDLPRLLASKFIRHEPTHSTGPRLRLRIIHRPGPRFAIQVRSGDPECPLP